MIIQCENCKTEFNLDESLIKEGGSKVRCSVCQEIFMAYPLPKAPPEDESPSPEAATDLLEADSTDDGFPAESKEALDREDFLDELDGLEDILNEPDSEMDAEKALFEEAGKNLLLRTTKGERQLANRPLSDFPSIEHLGEQSEVRDEGIAKEDASDVENSEFPVSGRKLKKKSSKVRFLLLIVFILIIGAATAFFYLRPEVIPKSLPFLGSEKKQEQLDPGVRLLMFSSVSGGFAEAENGGRFFVIRGVVTNKYPEPRSFILIKGSILDDQGKVVKTCTSYAGNSFTEEELKTLPYSEISKAMENRDGMARKNFNVPPGAAIPFMIVFDNLEGSLSEFTVEAVSSTPGT